MRLSPTALLVSTLPGVLSKLSCREIDIAVNVSAQNKDISTDGIDLLGDTGLINKLLAGVSSILVSGNYTIGARYCEPTRVVPARSKSLQLLVHGIASSRNYWSGLADPGTYIDQEQYSWIEYAAQEGYATLSVDRLCNGASSRPLSFTLCQLPLQADAMHAVIESARSGLIPGVEQSFDKIIYTGHSYGSLIGNGLAVQHPSDVDAYILSGYTTKLIQGLTGVLALPTFLPAAVVAPTQFGADDIGYLRASNEDGVEGVFYHGDYAEDMLDRDYDTRGTVSLAELLTSPLGQLPAPDYTGFLFVLNGNEDGIFCSDGLVEALAANPGNCSDEYSSSVKDSYPAAKDFGFYNTANTGHCLNNHRTANLSFEAAHQFLAASGF